jgi:hypothetical protein
LPVLLAVLRVLLRRRLAVLLVLLVLLLLAVLLILRLRRLAILLVLLGGLAVVPLLLRGRGARGRRTRGLVGVFPLLGVIVLLRNGGSDRRAGGRVRGQTAEEGDGTGVAERARVGRRVPVSRRDAGDAREFLARRHPSPRQREGVEALRERDRDFDALLFADRGSRTDTVGGCVSSGPAKGLCGGNWMNPDPTTREGFCGAKRDGSTGSGDLGQQRRASANERVPRSARGADAAFLES